MLRSYVRLRAEKWMTMMDLVWFDYDSIVVDGMGFEGLLGFYW
jgi:hypothetical protein